MLPCRGGLEAGHGHIFLWVAVMRSIKSQLSYHNERTIHSNWISSLFRGSFYPKFTFVLCSPVSCDMSTDECTLALTYYIISPCSHLATKESSWSLQTSVIMNGSTSVSSSQTPRIKSETGTVTRWWIDTQLLCCYIVLAGTPFDFAHTNVHCIRCALSVSRCRYMEQRGLSDTAGEDTQSVTWRRRYEI